MQVEQIEQLLQQIEGMRHDEDAAHSHEDELYRKVLKANRSRSIQCARVVEGSVEVFDDQISEMVFVNKPMHTQRISVCVRPPGLH